jgi:outer membrane protein TolC
VRTQRSWCWTRSRTRCGRRSSRFRRRISAALAQEFGVRQAQRGYEIASAQYREGISSALELTDAEVALRQSEFNYAEASTIISSRARRLDEATGNDRGEVVR